MEYSKKYELLYLIIAYYSLFLSLTSKNKKNKIFFFIQIIISMAYPKYYVIYKLIILKLFN